MESVACLVPLVVLLFVAPLVIALVALIRVGKLQQQIARLHARLDAGSAASPASPEPARASAPTSPVTAPLPVVQPEPAAPPPVRAAAPSAPPPRASTNWESVLGVKLFAWIGGFAFFLGSVFFVKYAFENNLITPATRVIIGALVGAALVAAGAFLARGRYRIPAQSLCATGVLVLYADIYAAHAFYALVSLGFATAAMCVVTGGALWLAARLDAQSVVWLAALGGFLTPGLLWTNGANAVALFGYIAILNAALAGVATVKRWHYFVVIAALGTVANEIGWSAEFFGAPHASLGRLILLLMEAEFVAICAVRERFAPGNNASAGGAAIVGFAALLFCIGAGDAAQAYGSEFAFPLLFFACAGLLAIAAVRRQSVKPDGVAAAIVIGALALTWAAEWTWHTAVFDSANRWPAFVWYPAILLLFAAAPYFCGTARLWPWAVAGLVGPLQFWFVYQLADAHGPRNFLFLLPLAFAIPPAINIAYLMRRDGVSLASGDNRLGSQIAAVLFFISAVFPVQFEREWITLGWAIEGVALLLVFRRIPSQQLRVMALLVLCAAACRLTLNPAVFEYHKRAPLRIWNWYLYAYGIAAACMFMSARLFRPVADRFYERIAPSLLNALGTLLLFLLLNIEIADFFSIGPTLTFSFSGDFARDMTYTISWALFAFALLLIGIFRNARLVRLAAIALLGLTVAKLFLHDLDELNQLYRIAAFLSVAVIAIVASFAYQRFLAPAVRQSPPP